MAFLDDISRKISQASQNTIQKAKDHSDVSRLEGLISGEEATVNNSYYQIGKLFFSMHADDCEDEFKNLVNLVYDSEARIHEYQEQIKQIKGIIKCTKCGADVPRGVAFCNYCGNPMPRETVNEFQVKCTNCGSFIDKNLRFCTICGKPITFAAGGVTPPQQFAANPEPQADNYNIPQTEINDIPPENNSEFQNTYVAPNTENSVPAQSEENTAPVFCSNCGTKMEPDSVFCAECGMRM